MYQKTISKLFTVFTKLKLKKITLSRVWPTDAIKKNEMLLKNISMSFKIPKYLNSEYGQLTQKL